MNHRHQGRSSLGKRQGALHLDPSGFIPSPSDREGESPLVKLKEGSMKPTEAPTKAELIARRNDKFRQVETMSVSQGVFSLQDVLGLIRAVRNYKDFSEDNDPYGEHDFGSLDWEGQKIFWKIDYYDAAFEGWADPLSNEVERVLTVYLAEEH